MKRLSFIFGICLITLFSSAQIPMDSVSFKAYAVSIYYNNRILSAASDHLFYINNGKVISTADNQYRSINFISTPAPRDMGFHQDNLVAECKDQGGYACSFFIVYTPGSETYSGKDVYSIAIGYSNILFIYECHKTNELPWFMQYENDPLSVENLLKMNSQYRNDPKYTDEEIEEFFNQFGNGKIIKNAIIQDFIIKNISGGFAKVEIN